MMGPGSTERTIVGVVNIGVARGHERWSKEPRCWVEEDLFGMVPYFFMPKDVTTDEIERAMEPALLAAIDYVASGLASSDRKATRRVWEWSEAQ
jgi:hypothetical protein